MPLNRRLTILIAVAFGGLLLASVLINAGRSRNFAERATATPGVAQEGEIYPDVEPSAIRRVSVSDPASKARITFTKAPGNWTATDEQGADKPVDLAAISRMIQILGTLRYNRVIMDSDVAAYGLAGGGKVGIEFDTGNHHTLRIGDVAQVSGFTFVQRDQDPAIYLVPTQTLGLVSGMLATPTPTS